MKKIFLIVLFYIFLNNIFSQPQWKFYVAFEDVTGAKDTLWMIYDVSAHGTLPTDSALGEGGCQFDYSKMNMWIYNYDFDSTKTIALPYSGYPSHALNNIKAFNYQYPIMISWDTSLFNSPILPSQPNLYINVARIDNDYFWSENNDPLLQAFNMLLDNHVSAPAFFWLSQEHFPMTITFYYTINPGIFSTPILRYYESIFPIPFDNEIFITTFQPLKGLSISDVNGIIQKTIQFEKELILNRFQLTLDDLKNGIYFIRFNYYDGYISHKKIIKFS